MVFQIRRFFLCTARSSAVRRWAVTMLWVPLLAASAPSVGAQEALRPGATLLGRLEVSDSTDAEGFPVDVYRLEAASGTRVRITLESPDFDAYLMVGRLQDGAVEVVAANDDASGLAADTDARVIATLTEEDGWLVEVSAFDAEMTGGYRLRAEAIPPGMEMPRTIAPGERHTGTLSTTDPSLDDGTLYDVYLFPAQEGARIFVSLEADFDAYLMVGPDRGTAMSPVEGVEDDNGLGGTDSFVEYTVPESGRHRIVVTSLSPQEGDYALRLWTPSLRGDGDRGPSELENVAMTPEDREGLKLDEQRVWNDALGFSFPSPGPGFVLAEPPPDLTQAADEAPNYWGWVMQDAQETAVVTILAFKVPGVVTEPMLLDLEGSVLGGAAERMGGEAPPGTLRWEERSFERVLHAGEAGGRSRMEWRCTGSGADRAPGLIVCLNGISTVGGSFLEEFRGLQVQ
jgi:hypothetical protein